MATALMNFGAFFCLHYISVLYVFFFKLEANTLIRPFVKLNVLYLGPVMYSYIGNCK